jgi:hypothetical protein
LLNQRARKFTVLSARATVSTSGAGFTITPGVDRITSMISRFARSMSSRRTFGRAISVYGCCALFSFSPALKVSPAHQHVVFWGGLRDTLALALVLGLPRAMAYRETMTAVAFGVVAFSIVVQGLTVTPLLHRPGELSGRP